MDYRNEKINTIINLIDTENFDKTTGILTIPEGTKVIDGKFYVKQNELNILKSIKGIKIPKTVRKIGKYAFRRTGISNIEIPDTVQEIEFGAFEACFDLIEVYIKGKKIPLVEKDSFLACEDLEKFYNFSGDINIKTDFRISNQAFSTCYKLMTEQNKWLMIVPEKESSFIKIINKILKSIGILLKLNGKELLEEKF